MRTREEIEADKKRYVGNMIIDAWEGKENDELLLEVLLDIRDLLNGRNSGTNL